MAKDRGKLRVWNIDKLDAKELALADCNNWSRKLPVHPLLCDQFTDPTAS